jgi:hypothetical protein
MKETARLLEKLTAVVDTLFLQLSEEPRCDPFVTLRSVKMSTNRGTQADTNLLALRAEEKTPATVVEPAVRPVRLRVEELESRLAPSAIWGD